MKKHDVNYHRQVGRVEHIYRKLLHILELTIAGVTIIGLMAVLVYNVIQAFYYPTIFEDVNYFLHSILNVVVGLEFVRMLIDLTPANTLEVLIVAAARHIIMNHDSTLSLVIGVVCIAILFGVRRFLIPHNELTQELVEME